MGKSTTYLNDEDDGDFFVSDDFEPSDGPAAEPAETRSRREPKTPHRHAARQRLDSRREELWLKQQLNDWDDAFEESNLSD